MNDLFSQDDLALRGDSLLQAFQNKRTGSYLYWAIQDKLAYPFFFKSNRDLWVAADPAARRKANTHSKTEFADDQAATLHVRTCLEQNKLPDHLL